MKKRKRIYTPDDAREHAEFLFEGGYYQGTLTQDELAREIFNREKALEKEHGVELPKVLIPKF